MSDLVAVVARAQAVGHLSAAEARQLRGRFAYARGQMFGRCGAPALRALGILAEGGQHASAQKAALTGLRALADLLVASPPRIISSEVSRPVLIFVDGACEPGPLDAALPCVGVGAVLVSSCGRREYFGSQLPDIIVGSWADRRDQQVVGQAELLPVLLASATWGEVIRGRAVVIFIDNDSARFGMISGYSPVGASACIINAAWTHLAHLGCRTWFARVPSASNIADGPSRGQLGAVAGFGAIACEPTWRGARGNALWAAVLRTITQPL